VPAAFSLQHGRPGKMVIRAGSEFLRWQTYENCGHAGNELFHIQTKAEKTWRHTGARRAGRPVKPRLYGTTAMAWSMPQISRRSCVGYKSVSHVGATGRSPLLTVNGKTSALLCTPVFFQYWYPLWVLIMINCIHFAHLLSASQIHNQLILHIAYRWHHICLVL